MAVEVDGGVDRGVDGAVDAGREFWRDVLLGGGCTVIPRWVLDPVPGVAVHEARLPDDVVAGLRRLTGAVPLSAVLLAVHAKVLAVLSGEDDVVIGYVTGGDPLPCRLTVGPGSWRTLLDDAVRTESQLLAHCGVGLAELRRELRVPGPVFDTVVDASSGDVHGDLAGDLAGDVVLRIGATDEGRRLVLRFHTDALDRAAAARIAGYHLTALAALVADPDAEHGRQSLLSAAELRFQVEGLAGPDRELPDRRFHELFEQRVRVHPEAVAAVQGERVWTYRELNARANRVGWALRARGLGREGVVAVVAERDLEWMASVIGVFKAGGVYLPVEPHFPAGRIATTLARAGCRLVVTEAGSTTELDRALDALPGIEVLDVGAVFAEDHAETDLGVEVAADQLAYIYFTSGSTGEPKGAMCEHAGMLNHLFAKIDDLGIGEGAVVAQTAPQCFDISLWQLVSALLVGGRTVLVEQAVVLDVERFVDTLAEHGVAVVQVVPSYLEAVVSFLERRRRVLPALRCVSATGEALKAELIERWFATVPGVPLVNAYGLTETSDDTNHEVMHRPPVGGRVPLGRPVANVRVYVVDEQLRPVPLGAPGIICFSGVCVGRGYVNDPERTSEAYLSDPHRPGARLYRGGDYGRWRPDGKLEFLGRRDGQVKVSGFRIEIGEVENTLLRVPGVRDGAVVVAGEPRAHLVAFYAAQEPLAAEVLRERLAASLPPYMVPAAFHWRDALPLTANGKIDKKALAVDTALAAEVAAAEDDHEPPSTPAEQRLAAAWAAVLGLPQEQIGRWDDFFDRGGTSLSAVKLAIALDRAVSLPDVTRHPVLADLAGLLDSRTAATGPAPAAELLTTT